MSRMIFVPLVSVVFFGAGLQAQVAKWRVNPEKVEVRFKIRNFGFWVDGSLSGLEANFLFDASRLDESSISGSVETESIYTNNGTRDKHLRSEDYFDAPRYPKLRLVSTKIGQGKGGYHFYGKLTMHGISQTIDFPFIFASRDNDGLFTASFVVNRQDFNIGPSGPPGDEVYVNLAIAFKKASP